MGLIGIFTSLMLVKDHYAPPTAGAWCDISSNISCSLVNTSAFSELLNVPVALLGVLWFIFLLLLARNALTKDGTLAAGVFWWSVLGFIFVIYMIIAEIILKALCPLCTIVHIIVLINFIFAASEYKKLEHKPAIRPLLKLLERWLFWLLVVSTIIFIAFNLPFGEKNNYDEFAKCLTEKGINIYSSFRCSHCTQQKELFGDSYQYLNHIECHPQGPEAQTELCLQKNITGTPTWIMEPDGLEIKREAGYMTIEELKEFSGCEQAEQIKR